ncbi:MAG: winged helix-turn-helix transcriptional regulator [Gammaproteobacteria bacterium]|nr:winged helix-turn-helix domain-containing protein [Gammaproteobacteria bacterium]MDE1887774.1 winged helix-turn-helix transcriptional regulator [Gammaproteobacteria bacterium]MDE2024847.1 winged helix-turn-helix transcriptional regulator [Gammaproteobacteria bacterium]MDE2274056.1 winged helix-turn-helix transcriptional regulator [Gammaproteobacteria bacterium]
MNTNLQFKLQVLGDPTRMAIFERLARGPLAVVDIADGLPVTRPAVSQHLKVLKDAGLVTNERAANRNLYQLNPAGVAALRDYLDRFWQQSLQAFKKAAEKSFKEKSR